MVGLSYKMNTMLISGKGEKEGKNNQKKQTKCLQHGQLTSEESGQTLIVGQLVTGK